MGGECPHISLLHFYERNIAFSVKSSGQISIGGIVTGRLYLDWVVNQSNHNFCIMSLNANLNRKKQYHKWKNMIID